MGVVEEIEKLGAEIQGNLLADPERPRDREIQTDQAGAVDYVRGGIAESKRHGDPECRGVEPAVGAAFAAGKVGVAQAVGTLGAGGIGGVPVYGGRHRKARLGFHNGRYLPAAENVSQRSRLPERKIPHCSGEGNGAAGAGSIGVFGRQNAGLLADQLFKSFGKYVTGQNGKSSAEAALELGFESPVVGSASQLHHGRILIAGDLAM